MNITLIKKLIITTLLFSVNHNIINGVQRETPEDRLQKKQTIKTNTDVKTLQQNPKEQKTEADIKALEQNPKYIKLISILNSISDILQNPNLESEYERLSNGNNKIRLKNAVITGTKFLKPVITTDDLEKLPNLNKFGDKTSSELIKLLFLYVFYKSMEFNSTDPNSKIFKILETIKNKITKKYNLNIDLLKNQESIQTFLTEDPLVKEFLANPTIQKYLALLQQRPNSIKRFLMHFLNNKRMQFDDELKKSFINIIRHIDCLV